MKYADEVVRNIQVKLDVPESRHDDVDATFDEFQHAAQHVSDYGWDSNPDNLVTAKNQLHNATYAEVRDKTTLQASLVQSARNLAANALSNCKDLLDDDKRTSKPEFKGSVVVYNGRTITYNDDHVTLATGDDRVTADYVLPHDNEGTPFAEYWTDEWEKKEATLHKRDGEYYLHVAVEKDVEPTFSDDQTENGVVLGVDLNVDGYVAVTSTGAFLGNADELNHRRDEYERRRGRLQQTGTRSAHLTIQSIDDRFAQWSRHRLHDVSNAIIREARENDCTHIAFERLTYIWATTLYGGEGTSVLGVSGHQGLLYYVMVGLYAIPALVLADTMEWEELVDIDWGVILLFGGGIALANGLADSGATQWIAETVFEGLTGAPIVVVVGAVVLLIIFLTEMTSNTATATIIIPLLISIGGAFATTLGLSQLAAGIFLAVSGAVAASYAFALPVATPPNAIVFGSGYLEQRHMMRAGIILNLLMTIVLTGLIWALFQFVWPIVLW